MSSLSVCTKLSVLGLVVFALGCQSIKTREDIRGGKTGTSDSATVRPTTPKTPVEPENVGRPPLVDGDEDYEENPAVILPAPPAPVIPKLPKVGIILGGGGALTYGHIGFLKELHKYKVPVHAVAGIEFASPMAGLFAKKGSVNDVEWQMFKLKDDDVFKKSLLGADKKSDVGHMKDFLATAFGNTRVENFSLPFACSSLNIKAQQVYLMNKGNPVDLMSTCLAYPPYFNIHKGNIAALREVTSLANYLRQRGANYIVFVNVLPPPSKVKSYVGDVNSTENVLWTELAVLYSKPFAGVDSVISLDLSKYGITDFSKNREIMNKGADSASKQIKSLSSKWGL